MPNCLNYSTDLANIIWQRYLVDMPEAIRRDLSPEQPLWLACSGGRDSMALLQLCHRLDFPIHVIHINHQLQSPSDAWQQLVADFCQTWQIAFSTVNLNLTNLQNVNEQTARTARYHAISTIIQDFYQGSPIPKNPVVALAHHANDQAETVLMNLCQGTGIAGLTGMASWSKQAEFGLPLWLWRPLLSVTRQQISEYVTAQNIPFVDDPTNETGDNQRAFFRSIILPALAERFDKVVQNISRTSQNMAEIGQIVQGQIDIDLAACIAVRSTSQPLGLQLTSQKTPQIPISNNDSWQADRRLQQCLSITALRQLPHARRLQLLHFWLKGEQKFAPNRQFVLSVNDLLQTDNPDQQTLLQWQGVQIRRYHDVLYRLTPRYQALLTIKPLTAVPVNFDELIHSSYIATPIPPLKLAFLQLNKPERSPNKLEHVPNLTVRMVAAGEKFARLLPNAQPSFHEHYKKICQRYQVPSWERGLGMVLLYQDKALALILPNYAMWLADVQLLVRQGAMTQNSNSLFLIWLSQAVKSNNECPFYLTLCDDAC